MAAAVTRVGPSLPCLPLSAAQGSSAASTFVGGGPRISILYVLQGPADLMAAALGGKVMVAGWHPAGMINTDLCGGRRLGSRHCGSETVVWHY